MYSEPQEKYLIKDLMFECLGDFCPEQYDVYKKDNCVAYVRLRGGSLTCSVDDVIIYTHCFDDVLLGNFGDEKTRVNYLTEIAERIKKYYAQIEGDKCETLVKE